MEICPTPVGEELNLVTFSNKKALWTKNAGRESISDTKKRLLAISWSDTSRRLSHRLALTACGGVACFYKRYQEKCQA